MTHSHPQHTQYIHTPSHTLYTHQHVSVELLLVVKQQAVGLFLLFSFFPIIHTPTQHASTLAKAWRRWQHGAMSCECVSVSVRESDIVRVREFRV